MHRSFHKPELPRTPSDSRAEALWLLIVMLSACALILAFPFLARAQDSEFKLDSSAASSLAVPETRLEIEREVETKTSKKPWEIEAMMELRSREDLRKRPQNSNDQSIHEISLGGRYQFDPTVAASVEFSFEQVGNESKFFAKEAWIEYSPQFDFGFVRAGQQFLPVGLISPRDNWFSSNPVFMTKIFTEGKAVDLGMLAQVRPLGSSLIFLEAGVFAGRMVREEDQRNEAPEIAPRVLSLKSSSEFHDAFVTYFEHDLAFHDPVKATGLGFELRSPSLGESSTLSWRSLKASLLTEYWNIEQIQSAGPDERTNALVLFGQLKYWRLTAGYRFSEATSRMAFASGSERLPNETSRLAFLDVEIAPVLSLRAERVIETQSEALRDEWVGRALLNWSH